MGLDISEWYTIKSTLILEIQPPIFTVTCLWTETIKILWIRGSDMAKHRQRPSPLFGQLSSEYSWQSDFLSADSVAAPKNWLHHLWDAHDIFLQGSPSYCAQATQCLTKLWWRWWWWWKEVKSDQQQRPVQVTRHHMRTLAHLATWQAGNWANQMKIMIMLTTKSVGATPGPDYYSEALVFVFCTLRALKLCDQSRIIIMVSNQMDKGG